MTIPYKETILYRLFLSECFVLFVIDGGTGNPAIESKLGHPWLFAHIEPITWALNGRWQTILDHDLLLFAWFDNQVATEDFAAPFTMLAELRSGVYPIDGD